MKLHMVSIRDIVANCYSQPQYVPSVGGFIRAVGDKINGQRTEDPLVLHPEHFEIWYLGTYEDENGEHFFNDEETGAKLRKQIAACANLVVAKN